MFNVSVCTVMPVSANGLGISHGFPSVNQSINHLFAHSITVTMSNNEKAGQ